MYALVNRLARNEDVRMAVDIAIPWAIFSIPSMFIYQHYIHVQFNNPSFVYWAAFLFINFMGIYYGVKWRRECKSGEKSYKRIAEDVINSTSRPFGMSWGRYLLFSFFLCAVSMASIVVLHSMFRGQ